MGRDRGRVLAVAADLLHIAGSGSFAAEIAEYARDAGFTVAGLVELLEPERVGGERHGLPIVAPDAAAAAGGLAVVGAGGDRRAHWALLAPHGWTPATVVHPRAHVSASAAVGPGCVIGPLAVVGAGTRVGEHAVIGRGALVGHHVELGPGCVVNPGANVGGHARIGAGTLIAMGAIVADHVTVGSDATLAAGAVAVRDVADGTRAQGIPARAVPA
jgi:sugar O-acyltransferase (sialic acid O-acetyltransferase NeuD family)